MIRPVQTHFSHSYVCDQNITFVWIEGGRDALLTHVKKEGNKGTKSSPGGEAVMRQTPTHMYGTSGDTVSQSSVASPLYSLIICLLLLLHSRHDVTPCLYNGIRRKSGSLIEKADH